MFSDGDTTLPVLRLGADPIAATITATDYLRRSPVAVGGAGGHKEWAHFTVVTPSLDVVINFSLADDMQPGARPGAEFPRIVLLTRDRGWDGDVETFPAKEATILSGQIDLTFGCNRLVFRNGRFDVFVALRERPITVDLQLTPITVPAMVPSIPMLDGPPLHWLVVPRLLASGTVTIGDRTHRLDAVPAYHDHNWGHFAWGHDVAWEWGFVLPDRNVPWCATFVRLTNRARTVALSQKLLVWRGAQLARVFRERETETHAEMGYLRLPHLFKVPRPMALVAPETLTDVPRVLDIRARADGEWMECRCELEDAAQVLNPSETEMGVMIFNEVCGRATVCGRLNGEAVAFEGRSVLEFIRYV